MAAWGAQAGVYWGLLGLVDGTRRMVLVVSVVVRTGDRDLAVPAGAPGGYQDSLVGCCVVSSGNHRVESRRRAV